ncbi:MAG: ATP-binding protein [Ilumatobacteraceae bacterium]
MELAPSLADLALARRFIRERLSDAPRDMVADFEIIVSELLTNAVEHGPHGTLGVQLERNPSAVSLTVDSPSPGTELADAATWSVADVDQVTGRGLGIVRRLADDVSVARNGDSLSITARRFF